MGSTKMVATYVTMLVRDGLSDWDWKHPRDSWGEVIGVLIAAISAMALMKLRGVDIRPEIERVLREAAEDEDGDEVEVMDFPWEEGEVEGTGKRALFLAFMVFVDVATLDFDDVGDLAKCWAAWRALGRGRVGEAVDHLYEEVD